MSDDAEKDVQKQYISPAVEAMMEQALNEELDGVITLYGDRRVAAALVRYWKRRGLALKSTNPAASLRWLVLAHQVDEQIARKV